MGNEKDLNQGNVEPVVVHVGCNLRIAKAGVPETVIERIKQRLRYNNPRYWQNWRNGQINEGEPRKICCYRENDESLILPKGAAHLVKDVFNLAQIPFEFLFEEPAFPSVSLHFCGSLQRHQKKAVKQIEKEKYGMVFGSAGCGKKILAIYQAAKKGLPVLVLVQNHARGREWREAVTQFLGLSENEIGWIDEKGSRISKKLTIAVGGAIENHIDELKGQVGFVIIDQCITADSGIIIKILETANPAYALGLARYYLPPRISKVKSIYMGPCLCHIEPTDENWRSTIGGVLKIRYTGFQFNYKSNFAEMLNHLAKNTGRNELIFRDILNEISNGGGKVLVVSKSSEQLLALERMLFQAKESSVRVLLASEPSDARHELIELFKRNEIQVLLADLDSVKALKWTDYSALIIAGPCQYGYPLIDACGILRGKDNFNPPILYDYVDESRESKALYERRHRGYQRMNIHPSISADLIH